ncbi:hypothetical protein [Parafrankia sp. FMc2]|uniref:hypothetical protein n=1 Tax=Parafrankia sp. FMc2 TaxID=3233196 RepID=UPI0034D5F78F
MGSSDSGRPAAPPLRGLSADGRRHQAQHPGHCAACGHNDHGPLVADEGYAHCPSCAELGRQRRKADRAIAANLRAGRARPYDAPNTPYRSCARCATPGPLTATARGDVCADGCIPAGR